MLPLTQKIKLLYFRIFRTSYKKKLLGNNASHPEFRLLISLLKRHPMFFIDAGANKGEFLYMAEKALPAGKIWAFEPLPWFAKKLKALFKGIAVFDIALSDKSSQTTIYVPVVNGIPDDSLSSLAKPAGGDFVTYPVQLQALDDLTAKYKINEPIFLKIDVEGHEFEVIHGAQQFISQYVQLLLVEIEERHHERRSLPEMIREIENMGFVAYYFHPQKKQLCLFSEYPNITQRKEDLNTYLYVNNFWFFAKQFDHRTVVATLNQDLFED